MNFNLGYWNEVVPVHAGSEFYNVAGFMAGANTLNALERGEVGDVAGKSLLHLQCHFGMDTLSWARLGAQVTGMDYSTEAIRKARELAGECGLQANFVCCNLYDLPRHLQDSSISYFLHTACSVAARPARMGAIAASYVKPGGNLHIADSTPRVYL
jgi:2-polyprenyl-3-methyl-5-hydroxy-6-metoxy-1,4-benzoquinol methylase